jgi:RNA 2',3'-cyclic 3'-phosphodiesterase
VIRAFIAVDIEPKTLQNISAAIDELRSRFPGLRWMPLGNLHVTLKFLGDIEETKIDFIAEALRDHLQPFSRFTISAKGLGVFPDVRRPSVLWVGLEGAQLTAVVSAVERVLEPLGFAPEKRRFQPHLTIARWRESDRSSATFREELGRWRDHEFGTSEVKVVILYQSTLKAEGAIHQPLRKITLGPEP